MLRGGCPVSPYHSLLCFPLPRTLFQTLAAAAGTLPDEWAAHFSVLERLSLRGLGLTGSIPRSLAEAGMPSLTSL